MAVGQGKKTNNHSKPLSEFQHHAIDLLRLAGDLEAAEKEAQGVEERHVTVDDALEVDEIDVRVHHRNAEIIFLPKIVANLETIRLARNYREDSFI